MIKNLENTTLPSPEAPAPSAKYDDLIARLESATGPSAGLDAQIWCALNNQEYLDEHVRILPSGKMVQFGWNAPRYTETIDVALTLVRPTNATAAIALCIAALKARRT